jgi:uncharacterized UPF0160 family protein
MLAVTHNGVFHADDVFAAAVLTLAQPGVTIERTRDPQRIAQADIAFDVGGGPYDHHQPGGNGQRANGIPYASFGLVWRDFGEKVVGYPTNRHDEAMAAWRQEVADEVDRLLVCQIDAHDNGVSLLSGEPVFDGVRPVLLASAIHWMNPASPSEVDDYAEDVEAGDHWRFANAVALARSILMRVIVHAGAVVDGRAVIAAAVANAADPRIVVLPSYVPDWQASLIQTDALYVVYPSAGSWRCQGVPQALGRYEVRRDLPVAWGGLNGAELHRVTGVADATFCHKGLFIAGAASEAGAVALARAALATEE